MKNYAMKIVKYGTEIIEADGTETMTNQLAAQALTIKTMREALQTCTDYGAMTGSEWVQEKAHEALALPDNSTEVLQAWLDKQLGEVIAWESSRNGFICKENKNPEYNIALVRKPKIK